MKEKWILRHCDLDLWPKVTKFNRVRASAENNHLSKTASKSVYPFGWNFVHKKCRTHRQSDRQTDTHTHTHRHTDKLQWKYNPSTISWRCKNAFVRDIAHKIVSKQFFSLTRLFVFVLMNGQKWSYLGHFKAHNRQTWYDIMKLRYNQFDLNSHMYRKPG